LQYSLNLKFKEKIDNNNNNNNNNNNEKSEKKLLNIINPNFNDSILTLSPARIDIAGF
jgi:hypothetical protein